MRRNVMAMMIVLLTGMAAQAQSPTATPDSSAAVAAGGGTTWDDEGQIGKGMVVGGRVDRRLAGQTFAEVSIDRLHHERTGRFSAQGDTTLFTGAIVQRFGRAAVQPYVLGGVTIARHTGTFGFLDSKVTLAESTDLGFVFGGGLAVRAGSRFEVGPEARFFVLRADTDSSPAFASWIGGRLGVRF